MARLAHLSLFSGIGGLDLAAEWAGMTTVAFCERDSFCQKVLAKHWPNTPIFNDIHTLTAAALAERGINRIDIISGGFPCQPYSVAGNRRGDEDDRALWPQMLRVIAECRPRWVVGENVTGIITMALDGVLASLEAKGYEAWPIVFPACSVGALHIRQRVFIVAYADHGGQRNGQIQYQRGIRQSTAHAGNDGAGESMADANSSRQQQPQGHEQEQRRWVGNSSQDVANAEGQPERKPANQTNSISTGGEARHELGYSSADVAHAERASNRPQGECSQTSQPQSDRPAGWVSGSSWWAVEPTVGRVAHGIPRRVDRLRALGNAVVPQQAAPVFQAIADFEETLR